MAQIVSILERIGQDSRLRYAASSELQNALAAMGIDRESGTAILGEDPVRLEKLLGGTPNICCIVHAPDDEEHDDDGDETPSRDDEDEDDAKQ
jgi:hypothetical protein